MGLKLERQGDYIRLETPAGNAYTMSRDESWALLTDLANLVYGNDGTPTEITGEALLEVTAPDDEVRICAKGIKRIVVEF